MCQNFLAPSEHFTDWLENIHANAFLKYRVRSISRYETAGSQWFTKTILGLWKTQRLRDKPILEFFRYGFAD
jgi:hypothetical protein